MPLGKLVKYDDVVSEEHVDAIYEATRKEFETGEWQDVESELPVNPRSTGTTDYGRLRPADDPQATHRRLQMTKTHQISVFRHEEEEDD